MRIAIPSYKRATTLCKKTLRYLERAGVPADMIDVFTASEEERVEYEAVLKLDFKPRLIVGVPGIHAQRRFIEDYYPIGTHLICFDDDVTALKMLRPLPLLELFEKCFELATKESCGLFGFAPSSHTLSLKDEAVIGLRYVIGACFGMIVRHRLDYRWPCAEDFTRSVEWYKRDGRVLRFSGVGITTRYWKEPGGLQTYRTAEIQGAEMRDFVEAYPELAKIRRREGKPTDCRLKLITEKRILRPFE